MIYYDILWFTMMYYDVLWYTMIYYDLLWYTMLYYDILWCIMINYYILCYTMMYYDTITIQLLVIYYGYLWIFLWGTWSANWFGEPHFAQNHLKPTPYWDYDKWYSKIGPSIWVCLQLDSGIWNVYSLIWIAPLVLFPACVCFPSFKNWFPCVFLLDQ